MKSKKQILKQERIGILKAKLRPFRVHVQQYSTSHFRIFGPTIVDYWPSSSRCWVTGSKKRGEIMGPAEVAELAMTEPDPYTEEQHMQLSHMRDL